jgi:hypothetical protein
MKGSRSRRGGTRPVGGAAPRRRGRGKPRATRPAPDAAAAPAESGTPAGGTAAAPLVAAAAQRIVAEPAPPARPAGGRRLWPFALPLLLLAIAGGAAWFLFARDRQPAPGGEIAGTAAVDIVAVKQLLRQLDFAPGPDDGGLDPATREAIRQFQGTAGLPVTGEPSADLLEELHQVVAPLKPQ